MGLQKVLRRTASILLAVIGATAMAGVATNHVVGSFPSQEAIFFLGRNFVIAAVTFWFAFKLW